MIDLDAIEQREFNDDETIDALIAEVRTLRGLLREIRGHLPSPEIASRYEFSCAAHRRYALTIRDRIDDLVSTVTETT